MARRESETVRDETVRDETGYGGCGCAIVDRGDLRRGRAALNRHWAFSIRLAVLGGGGIALIGMADHFFRFPLLTAALGPTIYVLVAHPDSEASRLRNSVIGHSVGVASGLAALAAFGLWSAPSVIVVGHASLRQAGASGLAVGLTLLALHTFDAHHAPAAATTLLIATGLAHPGLPLYGLIAGLAAVIVVATVLNGLFRVPLSDRPQEA